MNLLGGHLSALLSRAARGITRIRYKIFHMCTQRQEMSLTCIQGSEPREYSDTQNLDEIFFPPLIHKVAAQITVHSLGPNSSIFYQLMGNGHPVVEI